MIKSFADKTTAAVFANERERKLPPDVRQAARRKLALLDNVERLDDLRVSPGNRLEQLSGNRSGQFSLRINNQWRLCFCFRDGHAYDVEIVDYH